MSILPKLGNQIPFCEPSWYQGLPTKYFTEKHVQYRKFMIEEVEPFMDEWIEKKQYPQHLHKRLHELGYQIQCQELVQFCFQSNMEEKKLKIIACYMNLFSQMNFQEEEHQYVILSNNSMALPPVLNFGSDYIKDKVASAVIKGDKNICLAISEPTAGSDVAAIKARAELVGDHYIVSGQKKWITGGLIADYFTTAVRTGDEGMGGISLLLIEKDMPGVQIRQMQTQFDSAHNTTFITFENVKVPKQNLIGEEGMGFMYIMINFNHERFTIAAAGARAARVCYEESFTYAMTRKTFGKPLIKHQAIRMKLAEMARQIESLQDQVERVAFMFQPKVNDQALGQYCCLLKVNASRVFEFCAREAAQIFGGNSIVKEGRGKKIERLYRQVRASAIPGGSEEILLDFTIRLAERQAKKIKSKL